MPSFITSRNLHSLSFTVPVYGWGVICEGERQHDFPGPMWGFMLDWKKKTCFMEYESHREGGAEKGAGFSTEGVLEHREEGNPTERPEQVSLCCEYAGREVWDGQEFHFWEPAVCLHAGSGMVKALVVFALRTQSTFLSPSIPSSQRGQAVKFLLFPVCTVFNLPAGFGYERPWRYGLLPCMMRDGSIVLQAGEDTLWLRVQSTPC